MIAAFTYYVINERGGGFQMQMITMGKEACSDDYVIKNIRIFYPILDKSFFEFHSHTDKLEQK